MNPKDIEDLRKEFGYYPPNPEDYRPENWEKYVFSYVEKLEEEVISLRECIDEMNERSLDW